MQKLELHYDTPLSGNFDLKTLNFLFVFQVNCPGCFFYGIPIVNRLYNEFGSQMSFLGLSTAFEDFEFNTKSNTEILLHQNKTVGETKKALEQHGINNYEHPITFPVAMDTIANSSFDFGEGAQIICKINPDYKTWPKSEQQALENRVVHYLENQELVSLTFTLNQMRGTPSLLVFNDAFEILYHKFGHVEYDYVKRDLEQLIAKFK